MREPAGSPRPFNRRTAGPPNGRETSPADPWDPIHDEGTLMDNSNQDAQQPGNHRQDTRAWQMTLAAIRGWSAGMGRALADFLLDGVLHHR